MPSGSGTGRILGSRHELESSAEGTIHRAQPLKDPPIQFYARFKQMAKDKGRNPDHVKIIPGLLPILGDTEAQAQELADELGRHVHLENGRAQVGADLRMDLSELDYGDRIPAEWFRDEESLGSRYQIYRMEPVEMGMTLRELIVDLARSTGHQWMAGTPSQVADVCDRLIPELQDRGYGILSPTT